MADIGPIDGAYSTVNGAVASAAPGDRILINPGFFDWGANRLTVNKNISIIGNGADLTSVKPRSSVATIITTSYASSGAKFIDCTFSQSPVTKRLSGLVFSMRAGQTSPILGLRGQSYMFVDVDGVTVRGGLRIDHCRWVVPSESYTKVASASNNVDLSTFTGSGVLNVDDTTNFATSGTLAVATGALGSYTKTTITYTNVTPTSFTGCTAGTGTVLTGNTVTVTATPISDSVFLFDWAPNASSDYITGSFDHNFLDFTPFSGGAECLSFNCPGNPTGGTPNQYGHWCWNQPYIYGGGLVANGAYDAIYCEDNIIHKSAGFADSSGGGGSIIYRNNTTWGHLQNHGMESGNNMGPRAIETLYNLCDNTRNVPQATGVFLPGRGGGQVYYGNRFLGYPGATDNPYQIELYRATAQTCLLGVGDGKNIFDNNQTGASFTMNGILHTRKASGGAGTGDIYYRSNGAATPVVSIDKAATKFTISSADGALPQAAGALRGFTLINLTTTGPDGEQLLGAANTDTIASSYSLITDSIGVGGSNVQVTLQSPVNTAFALPLGSQWEMRRVIQYFCAPGAYSTPKQLTGNNKNNVAVQFTDGTKGWFNQQVFGIWQKDNKMKVPPVGGSYVATPALSGLSYANILPATTHDNALPLAGDVGVNAISGYPDTNTGTTIRVGADWEAPGFSEAIPAGSTDGAAHLVGPPYPGPLVAGTVGTGTQPPVISSSLTSSTTIGTVYSYTITASNTPTLYGATGLPGGLSVNTASGVISGTTNGQAQVYNVTISASNAGGTGTATLVLTVNSAVTGVNTKGRLPHIGRKANLARRRLI